MNTFVRSSRCLGVLLALSVATRVHAEADSPAPRAGDSTWGEARYVGQITGLPEQDTFGFVLSDRACTLVPRYSGQPRLVGSPTGEPERDSFGLVVEGEGGCSGTTHAP